MKRQSSGPLPADRQLLVHNHIDIVEEVTAFFQRQWPKLNRPEILSEAGGALVEAGRTYDPHRGPPFRAYATWRVWCQLRSWATRERRQQHPSLAGVHPVESEEGDELLPEAADADAIERSLHDTDEQSKDRAIALGRASAAHKIIAVLLRAELTAQRSPRGGEATIIARQEYSRGFSALAAAFPCLSPERRRIVILHYVKGQSLRKIALADKVDPKVVQQTHKEAIAQLAIELRKHRVTAAPSIEGRPSGFELGVTGVLDPDESRALEAHGY